MVSVKDRIGVELDAAAEARRLGKERGKGDKEIGVRVMLRVCCRGSEIR